MRSAAAAGVCQEERPCLFADWQVGEGPDDARVRVVPIAPAHQELQPFVRDDGVYACGNACSIPFWPTFRRTPWSGHPGAHGNPLATHIATGVGHVRVVPTPVIVPNTLDPTILFRDP